MIEDILNKELEKALCGSCSTTSAGYDTSELTLEKLQKAIESIESVPLPVIWFNPFIPEDTVWGGEAIDRLLKCTGNEKGYVCNSRYREYCVKNFTGAFGPSFIEREPKPEDLEDFSKGMIKGS